MGLKKMVRSLPVNRYIDSVREGTREQEKRAETLRDDAAPVVSSLKAMYDHNHWSELVKSTFPTGQTR